MYYRIYQDVLKTSSQLANQPPEMISDVQLFRTSFKVWQAI